jgi:hypothetical protein
VKKSDRELLQNALFVKSENSVPVIPHADQVPALGLGLIVQRLRERTNFGVR